MKVGLACGHAAPPRGNRVGTATGDATGTGPVGGATGGVAGGGPVFTESGGRAPRALLRRLACDSAITRVVFGPDGAVLDVGRARRTVTGQMRRAVIARDQRCVYPGCDQPPSRCEVHHAVTHWADGGDTSVANSALLCWYHHQLVDARGITMRWTGKATVGSTAGALIETGWALTDASGHAIHLPEPVEATHLPTTDPPDSQPAADAA